MMSCCIGLLPAFMIRCKNSGQSFSGKVGNWCCGSLPGNSSSSPSLSSEILSFPTLLYAPVCGGNLRAVPAVPFVPVGCLGISSMQMLTPVASARWKAVPKCTSPRWVWSALENTRSACSRWYLGDTRHRRWKKSRPASPQSVAMANDNCTYSR